MESNFAERRAVYHSFHLESYGLPSLCFIYSLYNETFLSPAYIFRIDFKILKVADTSVCPRIHDSQKSAHVPK